MESEEEYESLKGVSPMERIKRTKQNNFMERKSVYEKNNFSVFSCKFCYCRTAIQCQLALMQLIWDQ